jgi:hypothetical protein
MPKTTDLLLLAVLAALTANPIQDATAVIVIGAVIVLATLKGGWQRRP